MFLQEFKRIVFDRRFIFILLATLLLNGALSIRRMQPEKEFKEYLISEYGEKYKEKLKESDTGNEMYAKQYEGYIESILARADEQMANTDIFRTDSFSGRNIVKTKKDFKNLKGLELETGPEYSFNYFCEYNMSDFIMIVAVVGAVLVILDERKKGLWEYVYSTAGGRNRLAAGRGLAVIASVFIISIFTYMENIVMAAICGNGYGNLCRAIQSFQCCEKVVLRVNLWQYLCIVFIYKFIVVSFIALLLTGMVLLCRGYLKVFFIGAVALISEYFAYTNIDMHSSYGSFKYINIFAWLDGEWCIRNYINLNVFGYPVALHTSMFILAPLFMALAYIFVLISGKKQPVTLKTGIIKNMFEKLQGKIRPYRHNSMLISEIYKQLVIQKMFIIIAVAVIIGIYFFEDGKVSYDYKETVYNEYVSALGNVASEDNITYLQNEYIIWQSKYDEQFQLIENGTLSSEEFVRAQKRMVQYEASMNVVDELIEEEKRLLEKNRNGSDAILVNKYSYNQLLGTSGRNRKKTDTCVILAFGLVAASVLLVSENNGAARSVIGSTKNGRGHFIFCKYIVLFLEAVAILTPIIISQIETVYARYTMADSAASVHSLPFLDDLKLIRFADKIIPGNLSLGGALIIQNVAVLAFVYALMVLATLITRRMKNVMASMMVNMAVVMMLVVVCYISI